jgi:hypothetical protein
MCVNAPAWLIVRGNQQSKGSDTMTPVAQAIRNQEILKTEYSEKAAIDALYDELSKGIESLKKGDVYTIDEAWEEIDKI